MKRNLLTSLSLVVMSLMLNTTGAYAQSYVKADVPFAFNVGTAEMPARTYDIKVLNQSAILIQNPATGAGAISMAMREAADGLSWLIYARIRRRSA